MTEPPITFADEDVIDETDVRPAVADPGAGSRPAPRDEAAAPQVEPGSAAAVALLSQQRQEASRLVHFVALASQQLAQAAHTLQPGTGSITQKRFVELRDGLERAWRLAVAIEASVKEE